MILTYSQASQRAWRVGLLAAVLGFAVVAAGRVQLAAGLTTPLAYDITVWVAICAVSGAVVIGAGVCLWMRVSDYVATHRHQLVPVLVWLPPYESAPESEPVKSVGGKHRRRHRWLGR